jgi:hypothetical protein
MKYIIIILGMLSLSSMHNMTPSMLIAGVGASAYAGGRYYYRHLTNSVIPQMIHDAVQRICSLDKQLTTYQALVEHIQHIRNDLQANLIRMNKFDASIFRLFGGKISDLQNTILQRCQTHAYDMINIFFAQRIAVLKSFHEERDPHQRSKIWEDFYDSPRYYYRDPIEWVQGDSLHDLQTTLRQAFPSVSTTYVRDRYQQHLHEAHQLTLVKHKSVFRYLTDQQHNFTPQLTNLSKYYTKRARILIYASMFNHGRSCLMTTVPVYHGNLGYQSPRGIYQRYITIEDIAQCLKSFNSEDYDKLRSLPNNTSLRSTGGDVAGYPFYVQDAVIHLNEEHLPERSERVLLGNTVESIKFHDGVYKLPVYTTVDRRELTYAIVIFPFEIPGYKNY